MRNLLRYCAVIVGLLLSLTGLGQVPQIHQRGHSHNDYHQDIPLMTAYNSGMGSIEADVFLREGELFVAHEADEIKTGATLKKLYLEPLAELYGNNGGHAYKDPAQTLQLVIDIKQDYKNVIAELIQILNNYGDIFNSERNVNAIRIVLSGDMPPPEDYKKYPKYLSFDGRPKTVYTKAQLKRVAMISDNLKSYTTWNGNGPPTVVEEEKLRKVIKRAHDQRKPFRFWASKDNTETWTLLKKLGADWINTDHPKRLQEFFLRKDK